MTENLACTELRFLYAIFSSPNESPPEANQNKIITRIVFPCIPFLTTWKRLQMCNQRFKLIDVPLLYEDGYYSNGRTRQCSVTVEPLDLRVIVYDDYLTDCNNFSE